MVVGVLNSQNILVDSKMQDLTCNSYGYGKITATKNWSNANDGSTDLFINKKCHKENGIPVNFIGSQKPLTGNYAGVTAFMENGRNKHFKGEIYDASSINKKDGYKGYTEYLQGETMQPLEAGKVYNVSFNISLADKSARAVSCFGVLFSDVKMGRTDKQKCSGEYVQGGNSYIKSQPQILSHRIISDSVNWVTISGNYIAKGGEKYLTIGCFPDENFKVKNLVGREDMDSRKAYYYISDVSVEPYNAKPKMDPIVYGVEFIELTNLQFASSTALIETKYYEELDEVASWMYAHPEYRFFVAGYTDMPGGDKINDPLSNERAKAVKNYLVNKGVKSENIYTEGFGSEFPLENKYKSRLNRRVEIYLVDGEKVN